LQYCVVNEDNVINSLPQNKNLADADLIILDDTGFSIRHANCEWINSLQENKNDFCIIHKLFWSLNNNKLLEKLTENFSEKIVAVIDADDLREHGCNISRQLSWDKTIEDFLTVFVSNPAFEH
jgi:hypothetical protein